MNDSVKNIYKHFYLSIASHEQGNSSESTITLTSSELECVQAERKQVESVTYQFHHAVNSHHYQFVLVTWISLTLSPFVSIISLFLADHLFPTNNQTILIS